jgi:hypothetical protein
LVSGIVGPRHDDTAEKALPPSGFILNRRTVAENSSPHEIIIRAVLTGSRFRPYPIKCEAAIITFELIDIFPWVINCGSVLCVIPLCEKFWRVTIGIMFLRLSKAVLLSFCCHWVQGPAGHLPRFIFDSL